MFGQDFSTGDYNCTPYYCTSASSSTRSAYIAFQDAINRALDALGLYAVQRLVIDGKLGQHTVDALEMIATDGRAQAIAPQLGQALSVAASAGNLFEQLAQNASSFTDTLTVLIDTMGATEAVPPPPPGSDTTTSSEGSAPVPAPAATTAVSDDPATPEQKYTFTKPFVISGTVAWWIAGGLLLAVAATSTIIAFGKARTTAPPLRTRRSRRTYRSRSTRRRRAA